jgi:hypothetical protein
MLVSACELSDNIDPKSPLEVPVESIFTNALRDGLAHTDNMDQNVNVSRMLCQYISMTQYVDPSRYEFSDRQIPDGYWNTAYLVLRDLKEVMKLLSEEVPTGGESYFRNRANKMAIADIMMVIMMQNLVDLFGNVPYLDALGGFNNKTPAYDDARSIYDALLSRLTEDIETLSAGVNHESWGAEDLVYSGDVVMWRKFAATLKLRMGMRMAEVDRTTAQSMLSEALATGCLEKGESMQLPWIGVTPHVNTIYNVFILANRRDYVPSKTIIDIMEAMGDARMPAYFTMVDTSTRPGVEMLAYIGLEYGQVGGSGYPAFSHFNEPMFAPDFPATFACHAEVEFLLAEAAARGMDVGGGSAREHYEAGIAESHDFWGVSMDPDYLSHPDVAWDAAKARELIGTQKWIALYNRGNEGYASWRCLDWPVLKVPHDLSYEDIPMRMPYPYNEPSLNGENYQAAADAIGGDNVRTLIFWDLAAGTENPPPSFL